MGFSGLLKRDIIITKVGSVLNKSKGVSRRYTLFFEDILANYFSMCEIAGYPEEMCEIGRKWMNLVMSKHFRGIITKLPIGIFLNVFMKNTWIGLGLMDDFRFTKKDNIVTIETKNEGVTRIIGKNTGMIGFYAGILNVLFNLRRILLIYINPKNHAGMCMNLMESVLLLNQRVKGSTIN